MNKKLNRLNELQQVIDELRAEYGKAKTLQQAQEVLKRLNVAQKEWDKTFVDALTANFWNVASKTVTNNANH